jgi:chloramphenicol-sensitive protein RarD
MSRLGPNGGLVAGGAFFIWGLFPLYWIHLASVPTLQLLAHRGLWCAVAVWLFLIVRGDLSWCRSLTPRLLGLLTLGGGLVSINWGVYVWAINTGHVIDTSLGYFITPLVSVLIALCLWGERLNRYQTMAIVVATAGVTYLAWQLGAAPWIALLLALSFGVYGLVRKLARLNSVHGLAVESTVMMLPALAYLLWCEAQGTGAFMHSPWRVNLLLIVGGPISAVPLIMFSYGAQRVSLIVLGMLQYIAPTVALILGVAVFHEPFGHARQIAFLCIWIALVLFTFDGARRYWLSRTVAAV